jgi:pimeloyl-ACP methyl ester carboxylesterase
VLADATIDLPVLKMIQRQMFSPEPVPEHWERSFPYDQLLDPAAMVFEGEDMAATLPLSPAGIIDLGRIRAPTWILAGAADQIVRPELQAKPLARLLPQAKLQEVEGVGHMLHHVRPELVVATVREALATAA